MAWLFVPILDFYFWPIRAHSMHPPSCYGITHTRGKIKLQEITMKRSVVVAWWHTKRQDVLAFITLWWSSHSGLSQMRFPFKLNLCSTELLLNLNEIYIRNNPRCHQSPCSWTKRRASKHELLFKIYTLYIISPIAKMTYTNTNCKFQIAVKSTNANLTIQVI